MVDTIESSFQGYVSSTHDALLIFECVRRGVMPKVKRRLRDDERKLIKSGQVFVFDEKESGIKRWTDGLLWSPSRILFNFLVYRQVEKKATTNTTATARSGSQQGFNSPSIAQNPSSSRSTEHLNPLALGAIGFADSSFSSPSNIDSNPAANRIRSSSAASDTYSGWESLSMLEGFNVAQHTSSANAQPGVIGQNDARTDRSLVGSLTTSYPFAKGGLCKKTISIQVENSTQHLISYYTVEDVRSGRLRTPSSLPEIASLAISPIFLTKTSFRFPPSIRYGLDGIPRFDGEDESALLSRKDGQESSGEGTSSGSEAQQFRRQHQARPHSMQGHSRGRSFGSGTSRGRAMTLAGQTQGQGLHAIVSSSSQPSIRAPPLPHQIGGSGVLASSRRSFDAISRSTRSRYEPYPGSTIATTFSALSPQYGQDQQTFQSIRQQDQLQNDLFGPGMQNGALRIGDDSNGMFSAMSMSPSPSGASISSMMPPQQTFANTDHANSAIFSAFPELNSFDVQPTQSMNLTGIHNQWQDDNLSNQTSFIPMGSSDPSAQQQLSSLQQSSVSRVRYPTNDMQNAGIGFDVDHHHQQQQQQQQEIPFSMANEAQPITAANSTGAVMFPYNQFTDGDNLQASGMPSDPLTSPFANTMTTGDALIGEGRLSSPRKQNLHRARQSQQLQEHLQQHHSRQPQFQYQQFHQEQGQAQSPNQNLHGQAQTPYSGMSSIFLSKPEQ